MLISVCQANSCAEGSLRCPTQQMMWSLTEREICWHPYCKFTGWRCIGIGLR
jgi:hypothetical protein